MTYKMIYLARRNPALTREDWPAAWRSHAAFASRFPVIGAEISSLFYLDRTAEPAAGASQDYDGVAVISSPSAETLGGQLTPQDRARILEDELRVFSSQTPNFTFWCREALAHGGAPGGAAVIRFLARRPEVAAEAFHARWAEQHAPLAMRAGEAAGAVRYVHDVLTQPPPPAYPFDGISETWFADPQAAARSLSDAAVPEDLAAFCDAERSVTMLTRVVHSWTPAAA